MPDAVLQGQKAWAVIAVNEEETQATVDGILTLGILWLQHCRESGDGRRLYQGLKLIVPRGMKSRATKSTAIGITGSRFVSRFTGRYPTA